MPYRRLALALCSCAFFPVHAATMDLVAAVDQALSRNPELRSSYYGVEVGANDALLARSKLLPSVRASYVSGRNTTEQTFLQNNRSSIRDYQTKRDQLQLSQPLFRPSEYFGYRQATALAQSAENEYRHARADLAVRVINAYLEIGYTQAQCKTFESYIGFLERKLTYAERSLKQGNATRSDVADAKARLDISSADWDECRFMLTRAEKLLGALVAGEVSVDNLQPIMIDRVPLDRDEVGEPASRIAAALSHNSRIAALDLKAAAAEQNVNAQYAGHLPVVDLIVSRSHATSETESTIGLASNTTSATVQLSVPLFSGFGVTAATDKSRAQHLAALESLESEKNQLGLDLSNEVYSAMQAQSRVKALETALDSAQLALYGSQKGLAAGTRNIIDVLSAEQNLFDVRLKRLRAKFDYIKSVVKIRFLSGLLDEAGVRDISNWLLSPKPGA